MGVKKDEYKEAIRKAIENGDPICLNFPERKPMTWKEIDDCWKWLGDKNNKIN